jgi:dTDP-4-amino-4,6-dideoxygalactose transaminase
MPDVIADRLALLTGRFMKTVRCGRAAAGIYAALTALGLQGQTVGIPANTCYIVLWALLRAGCRPLLLDIDPATGNLPAQPDTHGHSLAAIIPCHMYGLPAPMDSLCEWAGAHGAVVIEDAALAPLAKAAGKFAGAWGTVSVMSFGAGKIIDYGVGGALFTEDVLLAKEVQQIVDAMPVWDNALIDLTNQWNALYWALHQYEEQNPRLSALYPTLYDIYHPLVTYRLARADWREVRVDISAVIEDHFRRMATAAQYDGLLAGLPCWTLPRINDATLWKYPLLVAADRRDDLLVALWDAGIHEATRWYPSLQTMTAALYAEFAQPPTPHADQMAKQVINLPLRSGEVERIADVIRCCFD